MGTILSTFKKKAELYDCDKTYPTGLYVIRIENESLPRIANIITDREGTYIQISFDIVRPISQFKIATIFLVD